MSDSVIFEMKQYAYGELRDAQGNLLDQEGNPINIDSDESEGETK